MTDSFQILATEYRPMVLSYLRTMVKDKHLAEDLTQETFLAAQKTLSQFKKGGNFGRWLRGIARNKALMHWRSSRRSPLVVDSRVIDGIDEVFDGIDRDQEAGDWWEQRKRALQECIAGLSKHLKASIEQVYYKECSLDEAATVLGASRAAVGQRLCRARNAIRTCISEKLKTNQNND